MPVLATEVAPSSEPHQRARRRMESLLAEIQELQGRLSLGGSPAMPDALPPELISTEA